MTTSSSLRSSPLAAALAASVYLAGCGGGESAAPVTVPVTPTVALANGSVLGNDRDASGVLSFKGIPYAAAPVGDLRWRAPQAAPNFSGIKDAKSYAGKCWAFVPGVAAAATPGVSEDCLYLNVWTGAQATDEKRPVMVWLHGGGFLFGTSGDPRWEGGNLAKKGVIVVSINYRLGVFGFLGHPDLSTESAGQASGMYGLRDQVAALQWVKNNIAAFGGDPSNITVFGESAGAHAIGMLTTSPLAKGTFNKAIAESGAFLESEFGPLPTKAAAEAKGLAFGAGLGVANLAALRAIPALQVAQAVSLNPAVPPFSPSIDGSVLPEDPYVRYQKGLQNDVPLLVGQNLQEGAIVFENRALAYVAGVPPAPATVSAAAFTTAATKVFGVANMAQFARYYPATTDAEAKTSSITLIGDLIIGAQTWAWAGLQKATGKSPVYSYLFKQVSAYNPVPIHVSEVAYVFQTLPPKTVPVAVSAGAQDIALAETMASYWTNFAKTGNPNSAGLPNWPEYTGARGQVMGLGAAGAAAEPEPFTDRFTFLNSFRNAGVLTINFLKQFGP